MFKFIQALTAVIALLVVAAAATTAHAQPRLIVVSDEDTTVYLFGTIHFMPPDVEWRTEEIDAAFAASDVVYFEADVVNVDPSVVEHLVMANGLNPAGTFLSDTMTLEDYRRFESYVASLGLAAANFEPMRPWFAALNLGVFQIQQQGYDPESGIDQVLVADAAAQGKTLRYFEDFEFQLRIFSDLSPELELEMLLSTIDSAEETENMLEIMLEAWLAGDYEGLDAALSSEARESYPAFYDVVFTSRNTTWTDMIVALMADEPGTFFIAVGSGHLGGPDGVPTMLRARGLIVE